MKKEYIIYVTHTETDIYGYSMVHEQKLFITGYLSNTHNITLKINTEMSHTTDSTIILLLGSGMSSLFMTYCVCYKVVGEAYCQHAK